jgi:hypothetical protein
MIRGEIWWANLPPPEGSAPAKRRPVLLRTRGNCAMNGRIKRRIVFDSNSVIDIANNIRGCEKAAGLVTCDNGLLRLSWPGLQAVNII